ncbi:hypothetical protein WN55_01844 [Dufourea novaeangliae]|uniref:Uncharacterized protein n=1 Tax=Dufourea novaeangliae TaxID=178035 RepID=A0A154PEY7_DUFNO|nr:hypothetical protein WN55_01844 [Dufourea novaeangliae]
MGSRRISNRSFFDMEHYYTNYRSGLGLDDLWKKRLTLYTLNNCRINNLKNFPKSFEIRLNITKDYNISKCQQNPKCYSKRCPISLGMTNNFQ